LILFSFFLDNHHLLVILVTMNPQSGTFAGTESHENKTARREAIIWQLNARERTGRIGLLWSLLIFSIAIFSLNFLLLFSVIAGVSVKGKMGIFQILLNIRITT